MLLSWVISLQPTEPTAVPANLGRAAHAWFLDQVARADPALSDALHAGTGLRPFTVSNLLGTGRRWQGETALSPERTYALRVTSFSPALSSLLRERVLSDAPETVSLGPATLRVTGSATDPSEHPWAGEETFEGLVQRHTLAAQPPRRVTLQFASPTLFRSEDKDVPLPLPGLVFGGLLDRWNAFAPLQVHPEVRRYAEECLAVSRYRLETALVRFGEHGERGVMSGCLGRCTYALLVRDRYWMGLIHLLAAFALYAGVGRRATMGLGQARALPERGG